MPASLLILVVGNWQKVASRLMTRKPHLMTAMGTTKIAVAN